MEERKALIRNTVDLIDGRCPFVVGVSHPSFRATIELAHMAEDLGAAALQVLAPLRPFGGTPTLDDLLAYFEAIAKETKADILLYLNPGPGAAVPPSWTIEIAKMDRVRFIKESSRDMSRVGRLIVEIDHAGYAKYFTTMQMLLPTLMLGGSGATMPPPGSTIARNIVDAFTAGEYSRAAELQKQFAIFPARWMSFGLAPVMKAAMEVVGVPLGKPYPPYKPLDPKAKRALSNYLGTTVLFESKPASGKGRKAA